MNLTLNISQDKGFISPQCFDWCKQNIDHAVSEVIFTGDIIVWMILFSLTLIFILTRFTKPIKEHLKLDDEQIWEIHTTFLYFSIFLCIMYFVFKIWVN